MLLNLRHLFAAIEINELGSLTLAAQRAHLSQSALTQGINKLEKELGQQLFSRTHSGMFVTATGAIFLARAKRAFNYLQDFAATLYATDKQKRHSFFRAVTSKQLQAFIVIADTKSYTHAASRLSLSQPTLHKAIKNLESLCGQTLFQRSPIGVEPTWRAQQLKRYARLFFAELNQGFDELGESEGRMDGMVRIGSLPLSSSAIVPQSILELLEEYPLARTTVIDGPYDEQLNALLHGQLDVIVGALRNPSPHQDVVQIRLFDDPLSIVVKAGHLLENEPTLSNEMLQSLTWVVPAKGAPSRQVFDEIFHSRDLAPPTQIIECSALAAVRGILLNSDRAALLPARQVQVEVASKLLAVCPAPIQESKREIGLTVRKHWLPTKVQKQFLRIVEQHFLEK